MKSLENYTFSGRGVRKSQYPWEKILDGGIYQCEKGEDFQSSLVTFSALARTRAAMLGKGIRVSQDDDKGVVVVQAYELPPDQAAAVKQRVIENRKKWVEGRKAKKAAEAAAGNGKATMAPAVTSNDAPAPKATAGPAPKPVAPKPAMAGAGKR